MTKMSMVKFRLKTVAFEVEFEGTEEFLHSQLSKLTKSFSDIGFTGDLSTLIQSNGAKVGESNQTPPAARRPNTNNPKALSTHAVARQLGAKTGNDVAFSAMAKLYFIDKKKSADRHTLLESMREAAPIFKENMTGNLTMIINKMLKDGKFIKLKGKEYSLSDAEIVGLETEFADYI